MSIGSKTLQVLLERQLRPVSFHGIIGSGASTTLIPAIGVDWVEDQWAGMIMEITSGLLSGEWAKIVSNTSSQLSVSPALSSAPEAGAEFVITTFGVVSQNIQQWGGSGLTPRDITTDLMALSDHLASSFTSGGVSVGTSSTLIVPANTDRKYLVICNDSESDVVYLNIGSEAKKQEGIRLNPNGGTYEVNWTNLHKQAVYGIAGGTGAVIVTYVEGE